MTADDKAVVQAMADYPLKKGQMLLISPQTVKILLGQELAGNPIGKIVFDKAEWNKK